MIFAFGGMKGGTGKSTLATNFVTYLAIQGRDVILVDADKQASSSRWGQDRQENGAGLCPVHIVQASGKINDTLMEMAKKYDCVAVDLQGRDSSEQRTAMMVADKLLIPVRPSQYDLDTLLPFLDIVRTAQDFNPRLVAKVVLSCCSTHPSKKEFHDAQSYVHGTGIELVGAHTCERKVYRDSAAEGKSIFECADRKAIAEMELLIGEILK